MSQLSIEANKESVIKAEKRSLGAPLISSPGAYEGLGDKVNSKKVRDSWSDITDILAGTGYCNGEEKGGVRRLPSPLYNRDPPPYHLHSPTSQHPQPYNQDNERVDESDLDACLEVEQARLEELVAMCCEYERQAQLERNGKLTQNRIKTNGSLTRDKRPPLSPSTDHSFSFDSSEVKSCGGEMKPPPTYENMVLLPGSPRPRIKTNPSKDGRDFSHENSENRIPLCLETEHHTPTSSPYVNILPSMLCQTSQNTHQTATSQPVELRTKTQDNPDDPERRSSIAETNANNKYNFLGFDPRRDSEDILNTSTGSEPLRAVLHSSPSWASPTIDYDSYPDYDVVDDQIEPKISKLSLPLDERVSPNSAEVESLRMERSTIMKRLTSLKSKVSDLELQEEEQMRESEIESALISGEIQAEREKVKAEELRVIQLKCKIQECEIEMEKCHAEQDASQKQFRLITDRTKQIIQALDYKMQRCESEELRKEVYESLTQQIEFLDAEKKAHEDLEFRLLEEEASWLSRREDIQREMSEAVRLLRIRQERLARLETPTQIDIQRVNHLKAIEQDRSRLKKINEELERLTAGPWMPEPDTTSSTTDDEVVRVGNGASVDDLDRITRVTSTTPIDISCNSLGRKTIRSLQEIERNRHLHLAKQGSLVIQEERQRVEELKKRVQDEVKAQWAQQRFNQSLTSLASDQSSLEPARDSGLGSEEPDKRNSPDEDIKPLDSDLLVEGNDGGESRPLSEASTCSEEQTVRLRSKSSNNLQRPLTRYLPIRGEGLDLRQHVLDAGHQADLCPGVSLDSTSCRGFLLKMGSRWPRWNKRWFVFDRTKRCLAYYSDRNEKKIRGGAYFQAIQEVYVDHQNSVKSPNPKVTFVVKSANRTFNLVAPSPEAMRIWVDVIFTGAEGYQQYTPH